MILASSADAVNTLKEGTSLSIRNKKVCPSQSMTSHNAAPVLEPTSAAMLPAFGEA